MGVEKPSKPTVQQELDTAIQLAKAAGLSEYVLRELGKLRNANAAVKRNVKDAIFTRLFS